MSDSAAPKATGSLERTPFPHLLVYCLDRALTGILVLEPTAGLQNQIHLLGGGVVRVSSPMQQATLDEGILTQFGLPRSTQYAFFEREVPRTSEVIDPRPFLVEGLCRYPGCAPVDEHLKMLGGRPLRFLEPRSELVFTMHPIGSLVATAVAQHFPTLEQLLAMELAPAVAVRAAVYAMLILRCFELGNGKAPIPGPRGGDAIPSSRRLSGMLPTASIMMRAVAAPASASRTPSVPPAAVTSSARVQASPEVRRSSAPPATAVSQQSSVRRVAAVSPADDSSSESRQRILSRAQQLGQLSYYELLELEPSATLQQVQAAFQQQAKLWHPDRLPAALADLRETASFIFAKLTTAYQVLSSPSKRATYDLERASGGQSAEDEALVARVLDAHDSFQKAEVMARRGQWQEAQQFALEAVQLAPDQPDHRTLLAWIVSNLPGATTEHLQASVQALDLVLRSLPEHQKALWYRGSIRRRLGLEEPAIADFRKLLSIDPRNVDSEREVRVHDIRSRPKSGWPPAAIDTLSSRFGKLFRR